MKKGICYIVGAGEDYGLDFTPDAEDLVIAADGGLRYLEKAGIPADRVVGDFDTLGYRPDHPDVVELCPEKDDTDTNVCIKEGLAAGYDTFALYGCAGGRIEHTIANLQLMTALAKKGCRVTLHGNGCVLTALACGTLKLPAREKGFVSVFSMTDRSEEVTIRGLKYEVENAVLENTFPLGVSNEFTGKEASVSVKNGVLIVVFPKDPA